MAIQKSELILVSKKQLTHDVFELIFTGPVVPDFLPGQYITFFLPSGIRRSYSIALYESGKYTFIIKKVAGGRGSVEICDLAPGLPLIGMLPLGHFVLPNHGKNFCFIGTGTGFAPLYCQIKSIEEKYSDCHAKFIFGVREKRDMFYQEELSEIQKKMKGLDIEIYLSQEKTPETKHGYVTESITQELVDSYEYFCLCGSPAMVSSAREKLAHLGVAPERIRFEQY